MAFQSKRDWETSRLTAEAARGLYSPSGNVAKFLSGQPMTPNPKSSALDKLNAALDKQLNAFPKALGKDMQRAAQKRGVEYAVFDSDCLLAGDYDPKTGDMSLTFVKGGGTWDYADVPKEVWQDLLEGNSGVVFNDEVRDSYEA